MTEPRSAARVDDYQIIAELRRTPACVTYRASHLRLKRPATIKLARAAVGVSANAVLHEARMLARLRHAGVPTLHHCGVLADRRAWIAIEPLPERTLADVTRPLSAPLVVALVRDLAAILDHAHGGGIVARVLRPDAIVLPEPGSGGRVMIADWYDASLASARAPTVHADPAYLAPELVRGGAAEARADIYALGAIAYRALSGIAPTSGRAAAYVSLATRCPAAPAPLTELIDRMLADAPCDRPATCVEVRELAGEALAIDDDGDGVTARYDPAALEIELEASPLLPKPRWTPVHGIPPERMPADDDFAELDHSTEEILPEELALPD